MYAHVLNNHRVYEQIIYDEIIGYLVHRLPQE